MGSYGSISISGKEMYTIKNDVSYTFLNLFSKDDYKEETTSLDGNEFLTKKFTTTCEIAKKRLDVIGYYINKIEQEFIKNLSYLKSDESEYPIELFDILIDFHDCENDEPNYELIASFTWLNVNEAIEEFLNDSSSQDLVLKYIRNHAKEYNGIGLPFLEILSEVRLILENSDESSKVEYDLSEIIDNGYAKIEDIFSFWNGDNYSDVSNRTVILTEGTTDIFVLEHSLKLLYPHLSHMYKFFDFDYTNSSGSTSSLVNLLKGFISSGISDRIIAIFDNDTAAYEALSNFDKNKTTKNIKIIHLPHLDWADNYPTLGPTGEIKTNINQLAVSIEFFMGINLICENNNFLPIQWTGYSNKMNRYQGEILSKRRIFEEFRHVIHKAETQGIDNSIHDWEQLKYLWETIFEAFNISNASSL